ncbi:LytR/AlgR family response regulator transcription factor [Leptothrix sp. BB-4]
MTSPQAHPSLRVVIAEDEPAQLHHLESLIRRLQPDWQIVAKVSDASGVLAAIDHEIPDLLVMDIHLGLTPEREWLERIPSDMLVIFCTGDPTFALEAFERGATDYILKPVTPRRLKMALDRAASRLRGHRQTEPERPPGSGWLTVGAGPSMLLVPYAEIIYVKADLRYTRIISTRGEGLARMGINELAERLPSTQFIRVHRGALVNAEWVASVTRNELGQLDVRMRGRQETLRVSRTYHGAFRQN